MFLSITCFSNISASLLSRESYVTFHHEPFILLHKYFPLEILSVLSENEKLIPSKFHFWFPSLEKYRFENQSVSQKPESCPEDSTFGGVSFFSRIHVFDEERKKRGRIEEEGKDVVYPRGVKRWFTVRQLARACPRVQL